MIKKNNVRSLPEVMCGNDKKIFRKACLLIQRCALYGIMLTTLLCASSATILAEEFLYPVATFVRDGKAHVYLLYQKSLRHIELWDWDVTTKQVNKALLSTFTPAGLKLLPDNQGFSFVDSGRIRVKHPDKRSPKSLDIYTPIYDISLLEWIDAQRCYFSAKEQDHYSIFELAVRGDVQRLVGCSGFDCMYPQKQNNSLFFIERAQWVRFRNYQIMHAPYPEVAYDTTNNFNDSEHFAERAQQLMHQEEDDAEKKQAALVPYEACTPLIDYGRKPIAFLHMVSAEEGFVLSHPHEVDFQDARIDFEYDRIVLTTKGWQRHHLFEFSIPSHLLFANSSSCLYESLLPLLPRLYDGVLYFVDCKEDAAYNNLNLYAYQLADHNVIQLSTATCINQLFFAPLKVGQKLFYGGSVIPADEDGGHDLPSLLPGMWIDQQGSTCFDLPYVDLL